MHRIHGQRQYDRGNGCASASPTAAPAATTAGRQDHHIHNSCDHSGPGSDTESRAAACGHTATDHTARGAAAVNYAAPGQSVTAMHHGHSRGWNDGGASLLAMRRLLPLAALLLLAIVFIWVAQNPGTRIVGAMLLVIDAAATGKLIATEIVRRIDKEEVERCDGCRYHSS